jgi:alkylation response protein AidB-like acyl-CoA dehydrogenase
LARSSQPQAVQEATAGLRSEQAKGHWVAQAAQAQAVTPTVPARKAPPASTLLLGALLAEVVATVCLGTALRPWPSALVGLPLARLRQDLAQEAQEQPQAPVVLRQQAARAPQAT